MSLKELRQQREQAKARALAIVNKAREEDRDLLAEEEALLSDYESDIKGLTAKIETAEALEARMLALQPAAPAASGYGQIHVGEARATLDPRAGFASMADFAISVRRSAGGPGAGVDPRLVSMMAATPSTFHREGGTPEGYLVPPEFRDAIWRVVDSLDTLFNLIDGTPTNSNAVNDLIDETTPWGSGGVQCYWADEAALMTQSKAALPLPRTLRVNKLYALVPASDELLTDGPRLSNLLTQKSGEAIAWKRDEAIINGTGVGQPKGYMKSGALVSVAKEAGQATATIVAANVLKMMTRILPGSLARAVWMCNQDILPQIATLSLNNYPMWMVPGVGMQQAPAGMLMGRPIRFNEHAKTLGLQGDLQLVDLKGYYGLYKSLEPEFATSIHLWFDYGLQAFRWTFRFGGQPHLSAPVSPANGSATKSHFVVLDDRP